MGEKLWVGDKRYIVNEEVRKEYCRICLQAGLMQAKLLKIKQAVELLQTAMELPED